MHFQEIKSKTPGELLAYAEELEIENASTLRTQDMMFAKLKQLAENNIVIKLAIGIEIRKEIFAASVLAKSDPDRLDSSWSPSIW